jgi:hypothetical protein
MYCRPGVLQLHAHVDGDRAADQAGDHREEEVEGADVLVVRRAEPADEEARLVIVMVVVRVIVMRVRVAMGAVMDRVRHLALSPGSSPCGATVLLVTARRP